MVTRADGVGSDDTMSERIRSQCKDAGVIIRRTGGGYELRRRNMHLIVAKLSQVEESDLQFARDGEVD
jgi:hypothetical protein